MNSTYSNQLITHQNKIQKYSPPGHDGTVNIRLFDRNFCENFEMVLGELEPGGVAETHHHETEHQAMYVLSGLARVTLANEAPVDCGAGAVIKLPPKLDHHVLSLGPDSLKLIIIYSPPLSKRGDAEID
ncbi:MAG: cupin domain-containing protein [Cohaesibacteraceae bacterium]|nr:cupin domain-containing protein [Cohaesibacteraceae bacterium]MBL4876432.1 cupin domain-containing protein [Cohaesibacteraceae bacterium]